MGESLGLRRFRRMPRLLSVPIPQHVASRSSTRCCRQHVVRHASFEKPSSKPFCLAYLVLYLVLRKANLAQQNNLTKCLKASCEVMHSAWPLFRHRQFGLQSEIEMCVEIPQISRKLHVLPKISENPIGFELLDEASDAINCGRLMTIAQPIL